MSTAGAPTRRCSRSTRPTAARWPRRSRGDRGPEPTPGPTSSPCAARQLQLRGSTDLDSYALRFGWKRPFPKTNKYRVHVNVDYGPADGFNPGRLSEPNPLLWQTEYWLEWTEEQVPVKEAKNVQELVATSRAAGTSGRS
jgi:hypothetical protein